MHLSVKKRPFVFVLLLLYHNLRSIITKELRVLFSYRYDEASGCLRCVTRSFRRL